MEWKGMEGNGMEYVYFPSYHYRAQSMGQYDIGNSFVNQPAKRRLIILRGPYRGVKARNERCSLP
jgi:hypothetical protein